LHHEDLSLPSCSARLQGEPLRKSTLIVETSCYPICKAAIAGKGQEAFAGKCGGVVDALIFYGRLNRGGWSVLSPTEPIQPVGQRVVVLYLERRSELPHLDFKVLALRAVQEAWPCSKPPR
jgi:hypothetical protein